MTNLLLDGGKTIGEIAWPAYGMKEGGTCDFMTPLCAEHCKLKKNSFEINSFEFFEDNDEKSIIKKLIQEMFKNNYTCISWWIGAGDCPKRMTDKMDYIIETISKLGFPQNGFTRNKDLWSSVNFYDDVRIALTVEKGDMDKVQKHLVDLHVYWHENLGRYKGFLISEPDYDQCVVKIYKLGLTETEHIVFCGGGYVEYQVKQGGKAPETFVEDCSTCLKNGVGCYGMVKSKKTRLKVKT